MASQASTGPSPYVEILRKLGPAGRLKSAERLYWSARRLKEDAIRVMHSDWTEAQISDAARAAFAKAR